MFSFPPPPLCPYPPSLRSYCSLAITTLLSVSMGYTYVFSVLYRHQLIEPAQQLYKVDDDDDCHLTNKEAEAMSV